MIKNEFIIILNNKKNIYENIKCFTLENKLEINEKLLTKFSFKKKNFVKNIIK